MNVCKVIGYGDYQFTDDRGSVVSGRKYHFVFLPSRSDHHGFEVGSQNVNSTVLNVWTAAGSYQPKVGEVCVVNYNRFGRIDSFAPLTDLAQDPFSDLNQ